MNSIYITAGIALMAFIAGWQTNGWRMESGYKTKENKAIIAAVQEERANAKAINDLMTDYEIQKVKDEQRRKETRNNIRSGAVTLSVPVQACYMPTAANDTAGAIAEARAELKPEIAQRIIDITDEGDRAIEQCNKLIDVVEAIK